MKVLLVDTAFAAAPIYWALIEFGHEVWVMGNRPGDLLARHAESRWIDHNYSDVSGVLDHIHRNGIECVVPGCTDISMETCSQLPTTLHRLDSFQINSCLSNKRQFRELCEQLNLPGPRIVALESFPRQGRFICKPVDAYSGRGISIFDGMEPEAASSAIAEARRASRSGDALIETFAGSDLYSCSGLLKNNKFTDVFFVKEGSSTNPYAVDVSYLAKEFPRRDARKLINALERLSQHLCLKDGLLHTQFLQSDAGPQIVEVSRRCPGDLYPLLIEYSTGFRYGANYAAYLTDDEVHPHEPVARCVLRHTVTADRDGIYGGLTFDKPSSVLAFYPLARLGEKLLSRQQNRAGILFNQYESQSDLEEAYTRYLSRSEYRTDRKNCS